MYINRALLLLVGLLLIFYPSIEHWALGSAGTWYRPYQLWLMAVIAAYWNQRSRYPDDL